MGRSVEIKDLGPSCNRRPQTFPTWSREVKALGWAGPGRSGGGALQVHKTDLWKSMSGWQGHYRHRPLYVSAEGSVLNAFVTTYCFYASSLIFCLHLFLNSTCFACDALSDVIKTKAEGGSAVRCHLLARQRLRPPCLQACVACEALAWHWQ